MTRTDDAAAATRLADRPTRDVAVPHRPALAGLRFRTWGGLADLPGMTVANQAIRVHDGRLENATLALMTNTYSHLTNVDLERDILIVERDGEIVGYARNEWRDQTDGVRTFETFCNLHPAQRRQGIGRAMLAWGETRLAELVAQLPTEQPRQFGSWTPASDGAIALLEGAGWTNHHLAHELLRPHLDDIPELTMPDGLEVRPLSRADGPRLWTALVEGFRDHPDEPESSPEDEREFLDDPRQDPALWVVAFDGDEIAGGVLNALETRPGGAGPSQRGLLNAVFTRPAWRRRGLARALIARSLTLLRDRGMVDAYLGVDAANPNQAMTLYESLGFRLAATEIRWTKPVPADEG